MKWTVTVKEAVVEQLKWFGKKTGRQLLREALKFLERDPLEESKNKNMKNLRPNPIAERELRLFGKYRLLFSVDVEANQVTVVLAGEKRGNKLLVCGKEFTEHHESNSPE